MNATKTHTLIVRKVPKSVKNRLKRMAKSNYKGSVNDEVLKAITDYLEKHNYENNKTPNIKTIAEDFITSKP